MTHDQSTSLLTVTLPAGALPRLAESVSAQALADGALEPIPTTFEVVLDEGVEFLVRIVDKLICKQTAQQRQKRRGENPFLPYDPALFVADVTTEHVCLLNKFNVLERHLLLVTRRFEEQEQLLNAGDFLAVAACLQQLDGLGFYNGGPIAGASQRHKHLQLAPAPIAPGHPNVPIEPMMQQAQPHPCAVPLPFTHVAVALEKTSSAEQLGQQMYQRYLELLATVGLEPQGSVQAGPYNLLMTTRWMLLVPRAREHDALGLSVNALGFAGCLLVREQAQRDALVQRGPMQSLRDVAA